MDAVLTMQAPCLTDLARESRDRVLSEESLRRERIARALHPTKGKVALFVVALLALSLLLPEFAFGFSIDWNEIIAGFIRPIVKGIVEPMFRLLQGLTNVALDMSNLTGPLSNIISGKISEESTSAYDLCKTLNETIIKPLGFSVLSCLLLLELMKVAQRMDSNATLPTVKEVLFLVVFAAFYIFLLNNSWEIMEAIYVVINQIAEGIQTNTNSLQGITDEDLEAMLASIDSFVSIDQMVNFMFTSVIMAFIAGIGLLVMNVITIAMSWARALQLYFYCAFSPIGFALLGMDHTRQMGIGFIKGFCAVCLSGAIMVLAMVLFPVIWSSTIGEGLSELCQGKFGVLDQVGLIIKITALSFMVGIVSLKSGQFARDMLGG